MLDAWKFREEKWAPTWRWGPELVVLSSGRDLAFEVMPEGDEGMNRLDWRRGSSYAKALGQEHHVLDNKRTDREGSV